MSEIDDGGPAFPYVTPETERHGACTYGGMTLRDYFAAHAPLEPQPWFKPSLPPFPPDDWRVGDWRFTTHDQALKWARENGGFVCDANEEARKEWDRNEERQQLVQWPYAWADAMILTRSL